MASGLTDAEVFGVQPQAAPQPQPGGLTDAQVGIMPPPPPMRQPSVLEDAGSGFAQPFVNLGHDFMEDYRAHSRPVDTSLAATIAGGARAVGDVANLFSAPVQAITRPLARQMTEHGPTPYAPGGYQVQGGKVSFNPARPLVGDEAQAANEGILNTALSGARPTKAPMLPGTAPKPLEHVQAAKTAAYTAADSAGVQFTPQAFGDMVNSIASDMTAARFNPRVHPAAASVLDDLKGLATQKGGHSPTLTELDQHRQVVSRDVSSSPQPGEQAMGEIIKAAIDKFIDNPGPNGLTTGNAQDASDLIKTARDLNTRFKKMEAITDTVESARQKAATANSGENVNNSIRRRLQPFLDPTSRKEMGNLSPDEHSLLTKVVEGTDGQNGMRWVSNLLRNKLVQAGVMWPTHGIAPAIMETVGQTARHASEKQTMKVVGQLLDTMSLGGTKPVPMLAPKPVTKLLSPTGLAGVSAVSLPLARTRSGAEPPRRRP